jgi:pSer/pThr/pTyr-binding forkhead associated (FHA) protein
VGSSDFPSWFGASLYGGLASAVLCALVIAGWALIRRRGVSGQVVGALLTCLIASALDTAPIFWAQDRLDVYGPRLSVGEVAATLTFTALCGWAAPLGAMVWYVLYAVPVSDPLVLLARSKVPSAPHLLDPARQRLALPDGTPWGALAPEPQAPDARPIPLTRELILIGRDPGNDLALDDDRVSRYHAELRWENGLPWLVDLASLNGTRVNQLAVSGRSPLHGGDVIELGSHRYRFESRSPRLAPEAGAAEGQDGAPEAEPETRKTAGISGAFSASGPTLALVRSAGATVASVWTLKAPVTTIGRDASCGITLPDDSVSRVHAQITRQPKGYFIVDLDSSNGVFLNGDQVTSPAQIIVGDVLRLGDAILTVQEATAGDGTVSPQQPGEGDADDAVALHMRIGARSTSKPRLAPPRLAPEEQDNGDSPT